jgi:diadenosine tetraphosphate (Ap4A) HIT family hydrolase
MASVFSKIMAGELPGHFVWQDEQAVGLMTIAPIRPGHVLVIPRQEIDHFDDLPPELAGHLMQVSQRIAKAQKAAYPCLRVGMMIAGVEVPHTHLHLLPIDRVGDLDFSHAAPAEAATLAAEAERIRSALRAQSDSAADGW